MMKADGRLVQNVEDTAQLGTDLRGQTDALAFAAGKRGRRAVEGDVVQSDRSAKGSENEVYLSGDSRPTIAQGVKL